jgi:23S rRNA (cytidine1920-2'-O)/16S rRNA (cytidine1409-2'-O)-methyltransferase
VHADVIRQVLGYAFEAGFALRQLTYSPITGGEGNIEFLAYWELKPSQETELSGPSAADIVPSVGELVAEANRTFKVKP